jgi:hypothetical protein
MRATRLAHLLLFDFTDLILSGEEYNIMGLLIMQLSPPSCYSLAFNTQHWLYQIIPFYSGSQSEIKANLISNRQQVCTRFSRVAVCCGKYFYLMLIQDRSEHGGILPGSVFNLELWVFVKSAAEWRRSWVTVRYEPQKRTSRWPLLQQKHCALCSHAKCREWTQRTARLSVHPYTFHLRNCSTDSDEIWY